uniref:Acyl_transf_3 domain-containing protein n=1 Tax=Syphacia muris TaxID=451379 RepID=A0A0N5AKH1_9BILA
MMRTNDSLVSEFFQASKAISLESNCALEIQKIFSQITRYHSLENPQEALLKRYYETFSVGYVDELVGENRWLHNFLECFSLDGLPDHRSFCYGYSTSSSDHRAYGICIPAECLNYQRQLLEAWKMTVSSNSSNEELDYVKCSNSWNEKPWYLTLAPMLQIGVNLIILTIMIMGTCLHKSLKNSSNTLAQIAYAFSLKRNINRLVQFPKDSKTTITCLFGLRFLSVVWTVFGHCFAWIQAYFENVEEYRNYMTEGISNLWITNFTLSVDTFFVISATLTAYSWFRNLNKSIFVVTESDITWKSWKYWLLFYRHRLIRLWPAYIITLTDTTYWLSRMHHYRMWPPSDPAIQCHEQGWQNILFLNSIFSNDCMGWTWYIGTEFIFYLLAPIFLLALKSSASFGLSFSLLVIGISNSLNVCVLIRNNYPAIPLNFRESNVFNGTFFEQLNSYYMKPQYRLSPYIVGLLLGYNLAKAHKLNVQKKPSILFQCLGWIVSLLLASWAFFGIYPTMMDMNLPIMNFVYGATHRTAWAVMVAWIIYACHTGIGGYVNRILSWPPFLPLSSLCYSVYLIHLMIIFATFLFSPFPMIFVSKLPIYLFAVFQLIFSYAAGFLISMFAEFPAMNLERIFLKQHLPVKKVACDKGKVYEVLVKQKIQQ